MTSYKILFFCIQVCLVHNVCSQCLGGPGIGFGLGFAGPGIVGPYGAGIAPGYPGYGILGAPCIPGPGIGTYGGSGTGDVAVTGELPVSGTTIVTGQVPIIGAVQFGGTVPAAGAVTISGFCNCGCNSGYIY